MLHLGRLRTKVCQGLSRREMLQVGACSALGLGLDRLALAERGAEIIEPPISELL